MDISDIDEWPNKWPLNRTYTYRMLNYSTDPVISDPKIQDKALVVAFRQFQLTIRYIKFQWGRRVDVNTDFRVEWNSDIKTFGNNKNVLAQAYLPSKNPAGGNNFSGLLQINDLWTWSVFGKDGAQFLIQVLIHELFHSLGFVHDEKDRNSTLWPFANRKIFFTNRDKTRLWVDYGRRLLPGWLVKIMMNRLVKGFDFD